jgi:hypothetical protein
VGSGSRCTTPAGLKVLRSSRLGVVTSTLPEVGGNTAGVTRRRHAAAWLRLEGRGGAVAHALTAGASLGCAARGLRPGQVVGARGGRGGRACARHEWSPTCFRNLQWSCVLTVDEQRTAFGTAVSRRRVGVDPPTCAIAQAQASPAKPISVCSATMAIACSLDQATARRANEPPRGRDRSRRTPAAGPGDLMWLHSCAVGRPR